MSNSEIFKAGAPEPTHLSDNLKSYLWRIGNKYYTADIHLCSCSVSCLPPECEFAANIKFQSVIIVFDQNEKASFKEVTSWLPFVESQEPSVLLLLSSGKVGDDEELGKAEILKWCLDHSFELIDMISEDDEDHKEDNFSEKTGIARVVEALQCAEWVNMEIEGNSSFKASKGFDTNHGATALPDNEGSSNDCSSRISGNKKTSVFPLPTDDLELLNSLASDGAEYESYEELFQKLAMMKERASSLPSTERKDYAEKVAIAFWRALGGSEEEISGLEEDDDG